MLVMFTARRGCSSNGEYSKSSACRAPSKAAYTTAFKKFKAAFPWIKTYAPWNEANHVSQPTAKSPKRTADYYAAMRANCRAARSSPPTCSTRARSRAGWRLRSLSRTSAASGPPVCGTSAASGAGPDERVELVAGRGLADRDRRGREVRVRRLPLVRLARRVGDRCMLPARRPLRLAQKGYSPGSRGYVCWWGKQRHLRLPAREPRPVQAPCVTTSSRSTPSASEVGGLRSPRTWSTCTRYADPPVPRHAPAVAEAEVGVERASRTRRSRSCAVRRVAAGSRPRFLPRRTMCDDSPSGCTSVRAATGDPAPPLAAVVAGPAARPRLRAR